MNDSNTVSAIEAARILAGEQGRHSVSIEGVVDDDVLYAQSFRKNHPYGYNMYFDYADMPILFPITPGELTITIDSNNEVVSLIDEGDINILKSPALTEFEFEARFPMCKYPYSRNYQPFLDYFNFFKGLKEEKCTFQFIVTRGTWDTKKLVALEEMELNESTDNGDDVIIKFKLKQAKLYGVKLISVKKPETTSTSTTTREDSTKPSNTSSDYTVKSGDTLWGISKKYYGKGSSWKTIYNANKSTIESAAKQHGKKSSSNGHWIYPGTKLTIPKS